MDKTADDKTLVYFDGSCSICRTEVETLAEDAGGWSLRDCSVPDFEDDVTRDAGLKSGDLMEAMHIRDADGTWHTGHDAIAMMYEQSGRPRMGRLLRSKMLRPFWRLSYWLFAVNRHWLQKLGFHRVLRYLLVKSRPEHSSARP